ncbi:MAG: DNA/RNA non-specific endonuclease [Odoribacteraceae bacterium]|nr:DNA/RNA non-specific endonuclease [Odoribacteraceae bacterium]
MKTCRGPLPSLLLALLFLPGYGHARDNRDELLPAGEGILVRHARYALGYNPCHKQANWVYYKLAATPGEAVKRTNDFREDPLLEGLSASPADYLRSGYDRGHLCPAADMAFDEQAMSETFYMSNISPQTPAFNRGIWKKIEEKVRKMAGDDTLHVVTGPLFRDNKGTIGANRVTVPGFFYKLFYSPARRQMVAFLAPNERGDRPPEGYLVPVDSVETWTGIDFFPLLPDDLERELEAAVPLAVPLAGTPAVPPPVPLLASLFAILILVILLFIYTSRWSRRRR